MTAPRPHHGRLGLYLVAAFVLLTGISWIVANPPGYAPDEPAHYTKAIAVGHRVWTGAPGAYDIGPGFGPAQLEWINKAARVVEIQPDMAPDQLACSIFQPRRSAACLDTGVPPPDVVVPRLTYVGTYEPFMYVLPGVVMNRAGDPQTATVLGRMVTGGIALILLVMAAAVLWVPGERGYSVLGFLAATTPMVLFIASGLSPSGPEIGAAVCVTAVVLRLGRSGPPTRFVWLAMAAGGAVLGCGRSLGPFYLLANVALLVAQAGPRGAWDRLRSGGRFAAAASTVVLLAVAANVGWGILVQPSPPFDPGSVLSSIGPAIRDIPGVLEQDVGRFGWADVRMPLAAVLAWGGVVVTLVALALLVGDRRQRVVLGVVIVGCFVGTVGIAAAVIYQTHFPMYGRYALPLWVIVPLTAGETVRSNLHRIPVGWSRRLLIGAAAVVGAVHFTGFYANARRYAVSDYGPIFFLGRSEWSPPGGASIWVGLVALGAVTLLAFATVSADDQARPPLLQHPDGTLALEQVEVGRSRLQP